MSDNIIIETDSLEYEILKNAALRIKGVFGMTCEIGVRRGGGSKVIIDALLENDDLNRNHLCIDPYGNIDFPIGDDGTTTKYDYHNQMRNDCLKNMYAYVQHKPINLHFFILEDTEFFKRYADGVPLYSDGKSLCNNYALVHFDGPHTTKALYGEIDFFRQRVKQGAMFVFDDIKDYEHDRVEDYLAISGWELIEKGERKASYVKL